MCMWCALLLVCFPQGNMSRSILDKRTCCSACSWCHIFWLCWCLVLTCLATLETCLETHHFLGWLQAGHVCQYFWVIMWQGTHSSLRSVVCCKMRLASCSRCTSQRVLPFWSKYSLVLSVLIWCLFLNPALAVRGRRLLATGISSHPDAVLSVFVSQCTRPHFLVDESRVPVCTGSNSVSFQHPTLLWDGRKSNCLPVLFFT